MVSDFKIEDYQRYATDTKSIEAFQQEFGIAEIAATRFIQVHTTVLDQVPKHNANDILFQINKRRSWAYFKAPENYMAQRHFFFESYDSVEIEEADEERIQSIDCATEDPKKEKARLDEKDKIVNLCSMRVNLRKDHVFIISRIHEFVQG